MHHTHQIKPCVTLLYSQNKTVLQRGSSGNESLYNTQNMTAFEKWLPVMFSCMTRNVETLLAEATSLYTIFTKSVCLFNCKTLYILYFILHKSIRLVYIQVIVPGINFWKSKYCTISTSHLMSKFMDQIKKKKSVC